MVAASAAEAVARAESTSTYPSGYCLQFVRRALAVDSRYSDAISAWNNATRRHPGDRNPPEGAPVFYSPGSNGYGHIALSLGGQQIRSTDCLHGGQVHNVGLDWPHQAWGAHEYLGWSEDLNGTTIPWLAAGGGGGGDEPVTPQDANMVAWAVWSLLVDADGKGSQASALAVLRTAALTTGSVINYPVPMPDGSTADLWSLIVDTHQRVVALEEQRAP